MDIIEPFPLVTPRKFGIITLIWCEFKVRFSYTCKNGVYISGIFVLETHSLFEFFESTPLVQKLLPMELEYERVCFAHFRVRVKSAQNQTDFNLQPISSKIKGRRSQKCLSNTFLESPTDKKRDFQAKLSKYIQNLTTSSGAVELTNQANSILE